MFTSCLFCQRKDSKLQSQKAENSKCEHRAAAESWTEHNRTQQRWSEISRTTQRTWLKHTSSPAGDKDQQLCSDMQQISPDLERPADKSAAGERFPTADAPSSPSHTWAFTPTVTAHLQSCDFTHACAFHPPGCGSSASDQTLHLNLLQSCGLAGHETGFHTLTQDRCKPLQIKRFQQAQPPLPSWSHKYEHF